MFFNNNVEGTADKFVGGELWAKNLPVSVFSGPNESRFVYSVPKNQKVGTIYSYIVNDGKTWWQLDNKAGRFVKHETGVFDSDKLTESLEKLEAERQKKIQDKVDERKDGMWDRFFGNFGELFQDIAKAIPIVIALVVILFLLK